MKFNRLTFGVIATIAGTVLLLNGCQLVSSTTGNDSDPAASAGQDLSSMDIYQASSDEAVVFYKREDGQYDGWGLHLWDGDDRTNGRNELAESTAWDAPLLHEGVHPDFGAYYVIPMNTPDWEDFMFIVHRGNDKDLGGLDQRFNREAHGSQYLFTFEGVSKLYTEPHTAPPVSVDGASAHWVDAQTIAFNPGVVPTVKLFYSPEADIQTNGADKTLEGGTAVTLERSEFSDEVMTRFPHLADFKAWRVPAALDVKAALKAQLVVATFNPDGSLAEATQVQKAGVLDDVYADAAVAITLGAVTAPDTTHFRLWAPTAQSVELKLYPDRDRKAESRAMSYDARTGVWAVSTADVRGQFYRYQVSVYHPDTAQLETYEVTDPYSLSLSQNSEYSQVVDLDAPELKPANWGAGNYRVSAPEDIVIYESHIRDFTLSDSSGSPALNGKYGAFLEPQRASMQHLQDLQAAGLTHLHLLPSSDIATINEFDEGQVNIDDPVRRLCEVNPAVPDSEFADLCASDQTLREVLASFAADSTQQQALMSYVRPVDDFNWGYDPYHYTVPEGSYATDKNGTGRILEYRQMVQALHDMGLNVVMDVVYNHTSQSGTGEKSVLDKIVPGYYHRLNLNSGEVENSTCCKNTATEHRMMEKLMIDSLLVWAGDYQIDAFRFDLMGHHMKRNIEKAYEAVRAEREHIYFYGEGWNFGEVADGARGENATQWNMAGTGIGTFSDRLRDAVRGGGPFDEKDALRGTQGFGNGLYNLPNEMRSGGVEDALELMHKADLIRVGLAGNLRSFLLVNKDGFPAYGEDIDYNGQPAGYTLDPQENVTYVSKHDNQTLWDNHQYRIASYVSTEARVRMHNLSLATNMMAQGVPFFQMGSDLLRSKSMARDSYDSGDWFNAVDFSLAESAWARGLPREDKDGDNWALIRQIVANDATYTDRDDREFAAEVFREFLRIRQSSDLFHLPTALAVKQRVDFHNTGADQIPGVIAMSVDDGLGLVDRDKTTDAIMVVINASDVTQAIAVAGAENFELHSLQRESVDSRLAQARFEQGEFRVPGLTVAVFSKPQDGAQGLGLPVTPKDLSQLPPLGKNTIHLIGTLTGWDQFDAGNAFQFVGNGIYAIELELEKGFYKVKAGNRTDLEFGKLGALLRVGSEAVLSAPGGVMNLQLAESGLYRFELDMNNMDAPVLRVIKP